MKEAFLLIILSFLVFGKTNAQENINLNQGYVENKDYFSKIKYQDINGKLIIDVSIESNTYKFLIDTGAPTAISGELLNLLQTTKQGNIMISDQSGKKGNLDIVSVPEIKIGQIKFKETPAFVSENYLFDCFEIDGIIGSNLLRNSIIQFNAKDKEIILTNDIRNLKLKNSASTKMIVNKLQSSPFLPIKLVNDNQIGNEHILFDSGDKDLYIISNTAYEQLKLQVNIFEVLAQSDGTFSMGLLGTADNNEHSVLKIPNFEIGYMNFKNVVTKTSYSENSRIGSELLKYGKLTLDYKKSRFWMEGFDNITTVDLPNRTWPVDPVLNDQNEIVVGIIWDKSLTNEINLGDKILQMGNINYLEMTHCEILRSTLRVNQPKAILKLQDKNTGKIKELELTLM